MTSKRRRRKKCSLFRFRQPCVCAFSPLVFMTLQTVQNVLCFHKCGTAIQDSQKHRVDNVYIPSPFNFNYVFFEFDFSFSHHNFHFKRKREKKTHTPAMIKMYWRKFYLKWNRTQVRERVRMEWQCYKWNGIILLSLDGLTCDVKMCATVCLSFDVCVEHFVCILCCFLFFFYNMIFS